MVCIPACYIPGTTLATDAVAYRSAYFGQGTGPILVDNAACVGSETALIQCSQSSTHNCNHYEDAGVKCNLSGQYI